jgi:putative aminopeptidase FrvX
MNGSIMSLDAWRDTILRWCRPLAPAGAERELQEALLNEVRGVAEKAYIDRLGNVLAHHPGKGPHVMLCAHVDEPGLMVMDIEDSGCLRVVALGAEQPQRWIGRQLRFINGVVGIIGAEESTKPAEIDISHLFVDIGANSKQEALERVYIGLVGVLGDDAIAVTPHRIAGRAVQSRIGCAVALTVFRMAAEAGLHVSVAFTAQKTVGSRGVRTAIRQLEPDLVWVIETAPAADMPGAGRRELRLGQGPALRVMDRSMILPLPVQRGLERIAQDEGIPLQYALLPRNSSDAGAAHAISSAVVAGISCPVRQLSEESALADVSDADRTAALTLAAVRRANEFLDNENVL